MPGSNSLKGRKIGVPFEVSSSYHPPTSTPLVQNVPRLSCVAEQGKSSAESSPLSCIVPYRKLSGKSAKQSALLSKGKMSSYNEMPSSTGDRTVPSPRPSLDDECSSSTSGSDWTLTQRSHNSIPSYHGARSGDRRRYVSRSPHSPRGRRECGGSRRSFAHSSRLKLGRHWEAREQKKRKYC